MVISEVAKALNLQMEIDLMCFEKITLAIVLRKYCKGARPKVGRPVRKIFQ